MPELVAGIGHRDRLGAVRNALAGEDFGALRAVEPVRIEAELDRQRPVQLDQPGRGDRRRRDAREKAGRQRRIGILEGEMDRHGLKIGMRAGFFEPKTPARPVLLRHNRLISSS